MTDRWFASVSLMAMTALAGCSPGFVAGEDIPAQGSAGTAGAGGAGGADGTGGAGDTGGTGVIGKDPRECSPDAPIDDSCGVFVSAAGDDENPGTQAAPKETLSAAIAAAKGKPIYACTDGVRGAVTVTGDATIYGGLDCARGWRYVGSRSKTPWTADANEIPLRIAAGARVELFDVAIEARDATSPGASSIGILAEYGAHLAPPCT